MIGTIDVEIQANNPSMPLYPMNAYINSPTSIRIRNVPKKIGQWKITKVYFTATYPDNQIITCECVPVNNVYVGTIEGSQITGKSQNGYTVFADGIDENGNPVNGYILGKGDIYILDADSTLTPTPTTYYLHLTNSDDTELKKGDVFKTEFGFTIVDDGQTELVSKNHVDSIVGNLEEIINSI